VLWLWELKRISSTLTVWPGEFIDLGQRLHEHLETGLPMGKLPRPSACH